MEPNNFDTESTRKLRLELIQDLQKKGITDELVLTAMSTVPRHQFAEFNSAKQAYADKAYKIGKGQTISQPYTVAFQTQLLELKATDKVLEIGTGSGYQTAILAEIAERICSIERHKDLLDLATMHKWFQHSSKISFYYGDGFEALPDEGPFDKILVTAAPPIIPVSLVHQLKPAGTMVLPVGAPPLQRMVRLTNTGSGEVVKEYFSLFSFVPMIKGTE